jgi:tetratricopeptide (TPR) repeat protein
MRRGAVAVIAGRLGADAGAASVLSRARMLTLALAVAFSGCAVFEARPRHVLEKAHARKAQAAAVRSAHGLELSQAAQAAIDRHDDVAAETILRQLVAFEPRSAEAHQRLGRVLQSLGRPAEAEAAYRRALELDPEYAGALTGLGSVAEAGNQPGVALARFEAAVEIAPNDADAHLGRARALEALGRADDALAAYFRTLEFAPNSVPARLRVATLQLDRNEPDQALARLDPLVEQDPDNPEARHQRGRAHLALGHIPMAVDDLTLAASKLPDRPDVHFHLALALSAAQKPGPALVAAQRALQLAPDFAAARDLTRKLRR